MAEVKVKKTKVAWGITGAGDKIAEIIETMKDLKQQAEDIVEIDVFLSKAAETMLKFYRLRRGVKEEFCKGNGGIEFKFAFSGWYDAEPQIRVFANFSSIIKYGC